jgi:hypothetical protein
MSETRENHTDAIAARRIHADASAGTPSSHPAAAPQRESLAEANAYVVEVDGQTVGIVARDEGGFYRFHASVNRFNTLEGRSFKSPREAERAAHQLARIRSKKARPFVPRARLALALT